MISEWSVLIALAGGVIGFLVRQAWDWFEKRAGADTPEDDKWEVYALLTFCDTDGPVKDRVLSARLLNELCITSINSTKDSNNYRPIYTMRQFRDVIIPNLKDQVLIEEVLYRVGVVGILCHLVWKDKLRYRLAASGVKMMEELVVLLEDLLYDKKRRDQKQHDLTVAHVNVYRKDKIREYRWVEINEEIANLDDQASLDDQARESEQERLEIERNEFMAVIETCEDRIIREYRDRVSDRNRWARGIKERQDPSTPEDASTAETDEMYVLKSRPSGVYVEASGYYIDSQVFVVKKGSGASMAEARSISSSYHNLREKLKKRDPKTGESPVLVKTEDGMKLKFTKDCEFTSSSQASSVVLGRVSSGPKEWKKEESVQGVSQ